MIILLYYFQLNQKVFLVASVEIKIQIPGNTIKQIFIIRELSFCI